MESHLGQSWALWLYFISFDWQSLLFGCIWKDVIGNLSTDSRPHDKSFSCYVTISCLVLCANESFNTYPGLPIKQVSMIILLGQSKDSVLTIKLQNSVVWFRNTAIHKYKPLGSRRYSHWLLSRRGQGVSCKQLPSPSPSPRPHAHRPACGKAPW